MYDFTADELDSPKSVEIFKKRDNADSISSMCVARVIWILCTARRSPQLDQPRDLLWLVLV
jgi:hypothetical protein